jgi:hypothetical protein
MIWKKLYIQYISLNYIEIIVPTILFTPHGDESGANTRR